MIAPLSAFLIDDEPLAIRRLVHLLDATGRVEIAGHATDPEVGLAELRAATIDVLFLDIQMPGLSGFQVVERLPPGPMVVFTTAYDQHAIQAFEANAADYLLKAIERRRLDKNARPSRGPARRGASGRPAGRRRRGGAVVEGSHLPRSPGLAHRRARPSAGHHRRGAHRGEAARGLSSGGREKHLLDTLAELERRLDPRSFSASIAAPSWTSPGWAASTPTSAGDSSST